LQAHSSVPISACWKYRFSKQVLQNSQIPWSPQNTGLLCKYEGWEIVSRLLHEKMGIIRQDRKMAGRAVFTKPKDQNLSNGNDYTVGKSNE
jgi:hypothetical protein